MTLANIAVVILPGMWCGPELYEELATQLEAVGYEAHIAHHLTNQVPATPTPSMYDDAKQIAGLYQKLADEGKEIIALAHSYGGYCGLEASKGFSKKERQAAGLPGGIIHILGVTALIPRANKTMSEFLPGTLTPIPQEFDGEYTKMAAEAKYVLWSDLPKEQAEKLSIHLTTAPLSNYVTKITWTPYKYIPISLLNGGLDKTFDDELKNNWVKFLEKEQGPIKTWTIGTGHMPMNSRPDLLVKAVRNVAGEDVEVE